LGLRIVAPPGQDGEEVMCHGLSFWSNLIATFEEDIMKRMRRILLLVPIVALAVLPLGCIPDVEGLIQGRIEDALEDVTATFTIRVKGDAGLAFSGQYMVYHADYDPDTWVSFSSDSHTAEGQVPREYTVEGVAAGAVFQKRTDDDSLLEVEIWQDGELLESFETTDPWGVAFVTAFP